MDWWYERDLGSAMAHIIAPHYVDNHRAYARSVQSALPEMFQGAGVAETRDLRDQLVSIAGVKKLYAICSSAFWILDNSLRGLERVEVQQVRLGRLFLARGSREWAQLRDTVTAMEAVLQEQRILPLCTRRPTPTS